MKLKLAIVLWIAWFCNSGLAEDLSAYEIFTHGRITEEAFDRSVLNGGYLTEELGVAVDQRFQGSNARSWIRTGSIREDDYVSGVFFRFAHHFYDPVFNRGLTHGIIEGRRAFEWALEEPTEILGQAFSWRDARRYFLAGLTAQQALEREKNMALTFRSIGQVVHLVQDMGSPEHTRNDMHAGFPRLGLGAESLFEKRLDLIRNTLNYSGYSSPLFDRLEHFWRSGDGRGFAEFSNRNFITKSTNFTRPENGNTGGGYPSPILRLDLRSDEDIRSLIPGTQLTGKVTFFGNIVNDAVTGESSTNPRMTTYSLFDSALEKKGKDQIFTINRFTVESAAPFLLPRAVGYSTGLIDYFFRGKLDVELLPDTDSSDPTVIKLSGTYDTTNGSTDHLVEGTLALYADRPDGSRSPVPSLEPLNVSNIALGQEISRRFQITEEAERFIAVYQGTLGDELKDATTNSPGGVIGKALGGVRAESIFPQGDKRMLRTADGVFPLPSSADRLSRIRWGHQDNTFVGTLPDPVRTLVPNQVMAFKIDRDPGSPEVPRIPGPDGTEVVSATVLKAVNFPFGVSLGVTVNYSQTVRLKELLATYDLIDTFTWVEEPNKVVFYQLDRQITAPTGPQIVIDQTFQFAQSFPIILDLAHFAGGPVIFPRPYDWSVADVAIDRQGRLLALVFVRLTQPNDNNRTAKLLKHNQQGQLVEGETVTISGGFQIGNFLWALIDVEKAEVLGTTASPTLSLSSENVVPHFVVDRRHITSFVGGPNAESTFEEWGRVPSLVQPNSQFSTVVAGSLTFPPSGLSSQTVSGRFRDDVAPLVRATLGTTNVTFDFTQVYAINDVARTNMAVRITNTISRFTGISTRIPTFFPEAQIIRADRGGSTEVLLFFRHSNVETSREEGLLVRWSPESATDTARALPEKLPPADLTSLNSATSSAALIQGATSSPDFSSFEVFTLVIDFSDQSIQQIANQSLGGSYILLDPKFLYNLNDTRFHTLDPSLRETVLPRRLVAAPVMLPPTAAYHLIRLR